jgi:hypothetical protein
MGDPDWYDWLAMLMSDDPAPDTFDPGMVIEYRGVWFPGETGEDALDRPPFLPAPSAGYWGWFLSTSSTYDEPHNRPAGLWVADVKWTVGESRPVVRGDWSQPGILWSYADTTVVEREQPPP